MMCLPFMKKHSENDNNNADQKHKNGNAIDTVHIAYPAIGWLIRISLPDVQIFGQLAKYSHSDIKDN
jgi:hypothetical protein